MESNTGRNSAKFIINVDAVIDDAEKKLAELEVKRTKAEQKFAKNASYINERHLINVNAQYKKHLRYLESLSKASSSNIAKHKIDQEKKVQREIEKSQKKGISGYVGRWRRAFDTISRYVSAAAIFGLVTQGVRDIVSDFLQLEQVLYRVSVISGETIKESLKLKDTIYQISSAFGVSAKEVSGFVLNMSKLGKTTSEIEELSKGAALLSIVLGEDMSTSGQLIVTTMNQFNLITDESNRG